MRWKWIFVAPAVIVGIVIFSAIGGVIVQQLWNWLLPPLFGWREITFWQALGLLVLCRILFGGSGFHRSGRSNIRRRMAERWEQRVADRMERMTPEERERFRQRLHDRFNFEPRAGESGGTPHRSV